LATCSGAEEIKPKKRAWPACIGGSFLASLKDRTVLLTIRDVAGASSREQMNGPERCRGERRKRIEKNPTPEACELRTAQRSCGIRLQELNDGRNNLRLSRERRDER